MSKGSKGSWEMPTWTAPTPSSYSNLMGTSYFRDNTYGVDLTPEMQNYYNQLSNLRSSVLSGLGITSPQRQQNLNQWGNTFTNEALRTSMPQLEQTMFSRGMGGSKLYGDAVTELLSKVATQAMLNREQLSNTDENMKLQYLAMMNPEIQNMISNMNALTGASTTQGNAQWTREWQKYKDLLPYTAKYNQKSGTMDMLGGGIGALGALAAAPFTGGASLAYIPMAYQAGSAIGGGFNQGPQSSLGSGLNSIASMFPSPSFGGTTGINTNALGQNYLSNAYTPDWLKELGHPTVLVR